MRNRCPGDVGQQQRQGYIKVGQFETILDRATVATMWRPVGG
jgi:hypothetical protein